MKKPSFAIFLIPFTFAGPAIASGEPDGQSLFKSNCVMCHDVTKKKLGPAVKDMKQDAELLRTTITKGRNAMPSYEGKLSAAEIDALVEFLRANQ